jgi:Ala-tRNA(Pro) deacylase
MVGSEAIMSIQDLQNYLDERHVEYTLINHSRTYTAQETAQSAHIPGREIAKAVVVRIDGTAAMVVQPATSKVHLGKLKKLTGAKSVSLADEEDLKDLFPDCELGAMPPFGNLYGLQVYVGEELTHDEEIAFNAGSHTELIKLAYRDFESLVHPEVVHI